MILGSMTAYMFTRSLPFRIEYIQGKIQNHGDNEISPKIREISYGRISTICIEFWLAPNKSTSTFVTSF